MKDITITVKRQKTELITFLVCFLVAFGLNVYAIIVFDGKWKELFLSIGFVLSTTVVFYVVWTFLRACVYIIRWAFGKKTVKTSRQQPDNEPKQQ